jgi:AcrR family transcriptional regulator
VTAPDPAAPRKQPRQARAAATVDAIIEAAARILEAQGLEAFNTNAVARLAGVSVGSLYQYFPAKDAIMAALIRRESQAFAEALEAALRTARSKSLAGAVFTLAETAVAHQAARPRLARLLDLEEERLGLQAEVRGRDRRVSDILAAFLSQRRLGDHEAALDILHMSRGMIDAALERGAVDGLAMRVTRAILGYLSLSPGPAAH